MEFMVDPFEDSARYFKTQLQQYQFFDKYSRFNRELGRRETWKEAVTRVVDYLKWVSVYRLSDDDYNLIYDSIIKMDVMPSMRLLAMAGDAAKAFPQSIYNCAYTGIDSIESLVEVLNISMNGVGVGFSVEKFYVDQLPNVVKQSGKKPTLFVIDDSTLGWCEAFKVGLECWFGGQDVIFDYSKIRPAGSVLRTKGGRASGYLPLKKLLDFSRNKILSRDGGKLSTLDVYDIVCKLADCVVSGGVRRVAMICLFDDDDKLIVDAKNNDIELNPHRYNSNNSKVLPDRPLTQREVLNYLMEMDNGANGEPGIFSRRAAKNTIPDRREERRFGLNPCGEIFLRNKQFCNLSSVVCRKNDTPFDLKTKVRVATIIGTIQSMITDFVGLSDTWGNNCREERLLGVDLNGQMDCFNVRYASTQRELREVATITNKEYAKILGINESTAITTVKPSGNSGVLLDVSSGMHPRWSKYYIRNIRVSKTSPLYRVLLDSGVVLSPENGQDAETATSYVVSFPMKSPSTAVTRHSLTALGQLDYWKQVKLNWTDHNPSQTIYYDENEILDVAVWIYENQDIVGGLSFLPKFDASYPQAPYIEITKDQYEKLNAEFPKIDFSRLQLYEDDDLTESAKEIACSAGSCDLQL